jgi:hypothetical protein
MCLDKLALLRACDGTLPVGRYAVLDEAFADERWDFPFIVKPRAGADRAASRSSRPRPSCLR